MEAPDRECLDLEERIIIIYYIIFSKKSSVFTGNLCDALKIEGLGQGKFVHKIL
jgi:hypothetical protein